jgi:hypothetical protein
MIRDTYIHKEDHREKNQLQQKDQAIDMVKEAG